MRRRDQRHAGLNYARPCRECVDNIMRIFFPHECLRDADGLGTAGFIAGAKDSRAPDKTAARNIHSRDTPLAREMDGRGRRRRGCERAAREIKVLPRDLPRALSRVPRRPRIIRIIQSAALRAPNA